METNLTAYNISNGRDLYNTVNIMTIKKSIKKNSYGVKFIFTDRRKEVGRAFLYVLKNGQHKEPFGLLEDVYVDEKYRGQGLGSQLILAVIAEAKKRKCYKLVATARLTKPELKDYYGKFGLKVWGNEFRLDL